MVVTFGLTVCVPPFGCRVYVLPSFPVTVTWVALLDVTVKVEELPAAIEAGLAEIATVGVPSAPLTFIDPHPLNSRDANRLGIAKYRFK
jgi:hypothetical protein